MGRREGAPDELHELVVIGAGPSGIAAALAAQEIGHDPLVLERGPAAATSWRNRHDHLHLNSVRWLSHLPGRPMPRRFGTFPSRDDFVGYLQHHAAGLTVRSGISVDRIDRGSSTWMLRTSAGTIAGRHVIVATGTDARPTRPRWPGDEAFEGEIVHAADFVELARADRERVLVVGPGNSGVDLLNHLVGGDARELTMSARHGMNIIPARALGLPTHPVAVASRRLPIALQDRMLRVLQQLVFGDLTAYGYPRSDLGALARLAHDGVSPAVDEGFVEALKAGRVEMRPGIDRFERRHVVFDDGRRASPDLVICATGYRPGLESLVGHLVDFDRFGVPLLSGEHGDRRHRGLWFFGLRRDPYGNLTVLRRRTRRLLAELQPALRAR